MHHPTVDLHDLRLAIVQHLIIYAKYQMFLRSTIPMLPFRYNGIETPELNFYTVEDRHFTPDKLLVARRQRLYIAVVYSRPSL